MTAQLLIFSLLICTLQPLVTYTSLLLQHTHTHSCTMSLTSALSAISIAIALDPSTLTNIWIVLFHSLLFLVTPVQSITSFSTDILTLFSSDSLSLSLSLSSSLCFTPSVLEPLTREHLEKTSCSLLRVLSESSCHARRFCHTRHSVSVQHRHSSSPAASSHPCSRPPHAAFLLTLRTLSSLRPWIETPGWSAARYEFRHLSCLPRTTPGTSLCRVL